MATRAFTFLQPAAGQQLPTGVFVVQWTDMVNGDDGQPFECPQFAEKCAELSGTFGAGDSMAIQGSNKVVTPADADFAALHDPQGGDIALTSANRFEQVLETPYWIRPKMTAGSGTGMTVRLLISTPARR